MNEKLERRLTRFIGKVCRETAGVINENLWELFNDQDADGLGGLGKYIKPAVFFEAEKKFGLELGFGDADKPCGVFDLSGLIRAFLSDWEDAVAKCPEDIRSTEIDTAVKTLTDGAAELRELANHAEATASKLRAGA